MPSHASSTSKARQHLSPPLLQRNNSATSCRSGTSVHSQERHRAHYSLSDPSALVIGNTVSNEHHVHAQHRNVFVSLPGGNLMPAFDSLVAAEQREMIEDEIEDERAALLAKSSSGARRRSVGFASTKHLVKDYGSSDGSHYDAAQVGVISESSTAESDDEQDTSEPASTASGLADTRPSWRRPGLRWLIPVVTCFALCMGMGAAPKQELMINLACLVHPPQTRSLDPPSYDMSVRKMVEAVWNAPHISPQHLSRFYDDGSTLSVFYSGNNTNATPALPPLTPADKWMIELQKRIAEDRARQEERNGSKSHNRDSPVVRDGDDLPDGEVPHRPVGKAPQGNEEDPRSDDKSSNPNDHPRKFEQPVPIDPRLCKKSPKTQAAAATITMTMTLCMGILSALTTGFWGAVSDRLGRTTVMSIAVLGLVSSDVVLILTATYPHKVPGGYRFILLGPIIDGLLGGFSTIMATNNAYISDVTPDGSRAASFGRFQGIMMFGFSMGPILGSALIKATGNIMSVFYLAVIFNSAMVFFVAFILPESLTAEARVALAEAVSTKKNALAEREAAERAWEEDFEDDQTEDNAGASGWSRLSEATTRTTKGRRIRRRLQGRMKRLRRRLFGFLSPLRLFVPKDKLVQEGGRTEMRKDYNLLLLVLAMFFITSTMAVLQIKGQFLIFRYGWTSTELGAYLTLMAGTRGFVLLAFMPLMVRLFKPIIKDEAYQSESEKLALQAIADTRFDLTIVRYSLMVDIFAYIGMSFLVPAPIFVILTCIVTFGSCTSPASNSLALNMVDSSRDAGRLFGGLAVVSAMSTTFFGPLLFALVFSNTVGTYAPTVFAVAAGVIVIAQMILIFVRLPGFPHRDDNERGRNRGVKRVNGSSISGSSQRGSF